MRPNQNKNRQRSRNGGRKHVNPLSRSFESNGPDVKVRGNAPHIAEKYLQLARDAQSSGDSVMAENYLQHAEHYFRIVAAAQQQLNPRTDGQPQDDDFDDDMPDMNSRFASPQPAQQPQQGDGEEGNENERAEGQGQFAGERQERQERPERVDAAEVQPEPVAPIAATESPALESAPAPEAESVDGEARKPRRPRRRRQPGGSDAEAASDTPSDLPAFLTNGANAAE